MVWRKIKETKLTKKDIQQSAIYGLYIIVILAIVAWIID